jgi:hypothetical protein
MEANRRAAEIDGRVQQAIDAAKAKLAALTAPTERPNHPKAPDPPPMILPRHAFAALERWERSAIERAEADVFNGPEAMHRFSDEAAARGDLIYRLEQRSGPEWRTKIARFDLLLIEALGSEGIVAVEDHPVLARLRVVRRCWPSTRNRRPSRLLVMKEPRKYRPYPATCPSSCPASWCSRKCSVRSEMNSAIWRFCQRYSRWKKSIP